MSAPAPPYIASPKLNAVASMLSLPPPALTVSELTDAAASDCSPAAAEFRSNALVRFPPTGRSCRSSPPDTVSVSVPFAPSPVNVTLPPDSATVNAGTDRSSNNSTRSRSGLRAAGRADTGRRAMTPTPEVGRRGPGIVLVRVAATTYTHHTHGDEHLFAEA